MELKKVLLIGSNPSIKSPDASPFHVSTRSRIILDAWFDGLGTLERAYLNVSPIQKEDNRPLTKAEIETGLPQLSERLKSYQGYKIVALGKTAAYACSKLNISYLEMPHPSGLNRQLNDPTFVQEKIKKLAEFISEPS